MNCKANAPRFCNRIFFNHISAVIWALLKSVAVLHFKESNIAGKNLQSGTLETRIPRLFNAVKLNICKKKVHAK